ncbi:MAG TPA: murein transglycosylase A [Allosphingosinicella sp.]|nr:murein transglycosylase A [Allosphingosinicella sp.]
MARPDSLFRHFFAAGLMVALASCVPAPRPPVPPPPAPVETPPPETALQAGVRPARVRLALDPAAATRAYWAFKTSCPSLTARADVSDLARPEDWRQVCDHRVLHVSGETFARFFRDAFELVEVGDGAAFATGYYEPEISGSRERRPGFDVPVYRRPPDLLDANPATGERGRGRVDEGGNYVLYHDRAAIEEGALAGRGLELAWAADPVDLFFLQIQGSGRLRQPDGSLMRIGYASQNGRAYVAIGRLLRERAILAPPVTMQKIVDWLRANPAAGGALMRENPSYVFFQELNGENPLGALGRPVTPRVTVAADPRFVPLGAPVLLLGMDNSEANGLWIAQDTGGAIRGPNRFDTFWGAGPDAARIAGGMQARGRAYILLPRGAIERLRSRAAPAQR